MGLSKSLQDGFNDQLRDELASAYLYLGMSGFFEGENLAGFAHWMRVQAQEEVDHAMKIFRFVFDREGTVTLQAIEQPETGFTSPLGVFERALEHERQVSAAIHELYALAVDEKDFASIPFLEWFISEQVEEESTVSGIVEQLRMAGSEGHALLMLDRELGARAQATAGQ